MALLDQLNTDMKVAMKAKDKFKLSVIRMLKAAVQNAEINKGSALSEDEEIELLARELKQRKESEAEFRQADGNAIQTVAKKYLG
ncbi:GatB/YqeY domain-containing protein [Aerococcus viridans]|uniref:GatB/YqeY domain-containing protein n=1 Tax=Aerococcus viridans TaxID=1377 RepID=UPI003B21D384